jgi:hypothetical protein
MKRGEQNRVDRVSWFVNRELQVVDRGSCIVCFALNHEQLTTKNG